ncbi:MAG: hypothetical protein CMI54_01550 [Parcubacteria group bacterium]|jgi:DNA replicative helicase MCM subunit Mcm2 (Cdc46/Mcm family)|nr:hypothetical protein [Parcubacteria group bacterium]|tara:strand:+ start:31418 stop:31687 length:270 start_codon:yes stop_codon:yes gene_type:complete
MSIKTELTQALTDTKTAIAVATTTTSTGVGTILDLIPDNIGKLATLVGIILSSVLIFTHLRKGTIEYRKTKLEMKILEEEAKRFKEDKK